MWVYVCEYWVLLAFLLVLIYLFLLLHIALRVLAGQLLLSLACSLRFLFLYHLHDAAETCGPKGRPVLAPTLVGALRLALYSFLRQFGEHHLVVFSSLNDHIGDDGLDPLVVAERAPYSLNQVLLLRRHLLLLFLVKLLDRYLLLILYRGPKLIWIHHDSRLRLLFAFCCRDVLLLHSCTDAWSSCASSTAASSYLPGWHSVPVGQLWCLCSSEPIVIEVIKQQRCLVRLHFLGQELLDVLLLRYLDLESWSLWVLLLFSRDCGCSCQADISVVFGGILMELLFVDSALLNLFWIGHLVIVVDISLTVTLARIFTQLWLDHQGFGLVSAFIVDLGGLTCITCVLDYEASFTRFIFNVEVLRRRLHTVWNLFKFLWTLDIVVSRLVERRVSLLLLLVKERHSVDCVACRLHIGPLYNERHLLLTVNILLNDLKFGWLFYLVGLS